MLFKYLTCLVILFMVCSCGTTIKAPKKVVVKPPMISESISSLNVDIVIEQNDFNAFVKEEINKNNPIIKDSNPLEVTAKIATKEKITTEKLVKKIITPFIDGHYEKVLKKTYVEVREAFSCILNPFKWGTCWRTVIRPVWQLTEVWIKPQAEVFIWVTSKVTDIVDKIFKVKARIHYPTYLDNIKIAFNNNNFEIIGQLRTELKFDYEQNLIPFGPTLELNGILKTKISSQCKITGSIITSDKGTIIVQINEGATQFSLGTIDPNLPGLEGQSLSVLTEPVLKNIVNPILIKLSRGALNKVINKAIDKNNDKLDFRKKLEELAYVTGEPKKLSKDLWLNLNPKTLLIGQLNGTGDKLKIPMGVEFRPSIEYVEKYSTTKPSNLEIKQYPVLVSQSELYVKLFSRLSFVKELIADKLNSEISNSSNAFLKSLIIQNIRLYNTNDNYIAISVDVYKKCKLFKKIKFATFYLTGKINFKGDVNHFVFKDVHFTPETRSKLLNGIYKKYFQGFVDVVIENKLEKELYYSIDDRLRILNSLISNYDYVSELGNFNFQFTQINVSDPYLTEESLEVIATNKGNIKLSLTPQSEFYSNISSSNAIHANQLMKTKRDALMADTREYSISKFSNRATTEIKGDLKEKTLGVFLKDDVQNFLDNDKILDVEKLPIIKTYMSNSNSMSEIKQEDDDFAIKSFLNMSIDSNLYEEINGKGIIRKAQFEDLPTLNEEIFYRDKLGNIVKFKYNGSNLNNLRIYNLYNK